MGISCAFYVPSRRARSAFLWRLDGTRLRFPLFYWALFYFQSNSPITHKRHKMENKVFLCSSMHFWHWSFLFDKALYIERRNNTN
jgi:hypothetical protein